MLASQVLVLGVVLSACTVSYPVWADVTSGSASVLQALPDEISLPVQAPKSWGVYSQFTNTYQWHPAFNSPYVGPNSLSPDNNGDQTNDVTLFVGYRFSHDSELWVNAEYDQGFGLNNTLGIAGFSSGEAYKVGNVNPYYRTPRLFYRKIIDLGGDVVSVDGMANQLAGTHTTDNVIVTVGKFGVTDIFDTNAYAHDPRADFLNWSAVDAGAFDYAADAWGYSYGSALEWTQSWWTVRGGIFDLSTVPNSEKLTENMSQLEYIVEFERRYQLRQHPGKIKFLVFDNHGNMGSYNNAVLLGKQTGQIPNTAFVRQVASRPGAELNLEQSLGGDMGIFARISANNGGEEAYEFTDINRSAELGISLQGARWGRADDTVGVVGIVNGLSSQARAYFAAGGLGILIGDGQLPDYSTERILESYYSLHITDYVTLTADYQFVENPAYNAQRGPVNIFALRLHAQY